MLRPQKYNELLSNSELVTCDSCGRILYHDAGRPTEMLQGTKGARANEKAWFYLPEANGAGRFAFFGNSKGSCTMRTFDAISGQQLERIVKKKLTFRDAFGDQLTNAMPLHPEHLNVQQDFENQLPEDMLEEFQLQARVAPREAAQVSSTH